MELPKKCCQGWMLAYKEYNELYHEELARGKSPEVAKVTAGQRVSWADQLPTSFANDWLSFCEDMKNLKDKVSKLEQELEELKHRGTYEACIETH